MATVTETGTVSGLTLKVTVTENYNGGTYYRISVVCSDGRTDTGVVYGYGAALDKCTFNAAEQAVIDGLAWAAVYQLRDMPIDENTFAPTT